ncbi:hypothetical protein [Acetobacterium malicum]|uniref:hypothetical protein n=1 Tax=Acetobacterium malicum TaxID=52692 RepID=UPI00040E509C|nr:hypothetical protein [Acetobacterium dehalogenans]
MKKTIVLTLIVSFLMLTVAGCGSNAANSTDKSSSTTTEETKKEATVIEVPLKIGKVQVYDFGDVKLHAYATNDALNDECYIVENKDNLVGIEIPAFTDNLNEWKDYIKSLNKPMNDILIDNHNTGGDYLTGMNVYATENAKAAIEGGATLATMQGLAQSIGTAFDSNVAKITKILSAGSQTIAGTEFMITDNGDTYTIEIPEMNAVYTHMLGEKVHSILVSNEMMDATIATLNEYQSKGYDLILSSHAAPETQAAVVAKIAYIEKAKELAKSSADAKIFTEAMSKAFPDYAGANYLDMTAGFLYQK